MSSRKPFGHENGPVRDKDDQLFSTLPCLEVSGDMIAEVSREVTEEIPFAVFLNGRHIMTAMVSPVRYEDFIIGYLFTEQIVGGIDEIESIRIEKNRISVLTKNIFKVSGQKKTILSGCGGSTSYIDGEKLPKIRSDLCVTPGVIRDRLREIPDPALSGTTGGIHIAALADSERMLGISRDIGRHNALDRVIGYGLRTGIDFSRTFALVSGQISSEIARKCLVSNIPILVSLGTTTTLAVEIGKKAGLTLIGVACESGMDIYSVPERIAGAGEGSHLSSG